MKIVRKYLSEGEFSPSNLRYNPETNTVESTPDGGTTWNADPSADPRHNPANLLPARTGDTARCDAAEAMTQHFKAQVDAFLTGGSILSVVNVWLGLLLFIPGVNIVVALLFAVADALFTTGVVFVEAAMTETVYDQIKCILYCRIDEQGQMSADALSSVYEDVGAQIGGVAAEVFSAVTSAWGEVGFSNAGASGEYTGDCSECTCEGCHTWFGVGDTHIVGDYTIREWSSPLSPSVNFSSIEMHYKLNPNPGSTLVDANLELRFGGTLIQRWALTELEGTETWDTGGVATSFDISVNSDFTLGSNYPDLVQVTFHYAFDPEISWEGGEDC